MTTIAEIEELTNRISKNKYLKKKDKTNETLTNMEMENLKNMFIAKLEEMEKLKTNVLQQKLLEDNDAAEWKTQLDTCLTKMILNFG